MRFAIMLSVGTWVLCASPLPLVFEGNSHILTSDLYNTLELRDPYPFEFWEKKAPLDPSHIAQSISALTGYYRNKGFFNAKITSEVGTDKIVIHIDEKEPIRIKTVQINSPLDLGSSLTVHRDDIFDQDNFASTKAALKKRYADAGYCNAEYNTKAWIDIDTNEAHLLLEATPAEPCTFGAVAIQSSPNIESELIASMLRFREGDKYNVEAIRQSYENLYAQEGITRVVINDNDRNADTVPTSVTIEEAEFPIRFTAGFGFSSDQGFSAQTGVKHRNFLGDLKTLSLDGRYSQIKQEATGSFTIPLVDRKLLSADIGYANERFDGYQSENIFQTFTAKYQNNPLSTLGGVQFDRIRTYDSDDLGTFENSTLFISSPFIEANYDTRDKPLHPTKGYWINAKLTGSIRSTPFSDASYLKSLLSGAYIASIGDHIFGVKLRWGTLRTYEGMTPSSYRFYAGGMNSNRAYNYRALGPKNSDGDPVGFSSIAESSFEYRFPIYKSFRGVMFSDATFAAQNTIASQQDDLYLGVGLGIRYDTPIGPLAFDVGVDPEDLSQYALHFRIGELF